MYVCGLCAHLHVHWPTPEGKLSSIVIGRCKEVASNLHQHSYEAEALHRAGLQHLQYLWKLHWRWKRSGGGGARERGETK